ncbi:MAG: Nuclear import receptor [Cirrosporium novae-zelandiae]|nr:MAG: Nuclear import receptor [Cirrosporium novae-zelandiae]
MATNSGSSQQAFAPVIAALNTMQSSGSQTAKTQAHDFLEKFQKSPEAWTSTHAILQSSDAAVEAKLFAATTLKGKITYDLDQLPQESLTPLRDSLLSLLVTFRAGPRPIRTQLCVCLADLAIQMLSWKDVLPVVASVLGNDSGDCVLEFLRVLPEEVTEGRKINLTEEELNTRTKELLEDNASQVLTLLIQYSQSSESAAKNPHLFECISSWLREVNTADVVNSPLLGATIKALSDPNAFDSAVDCICTIYRDTKDVDECLPVIQTLYPQIVALTSKITEAVQSEDTDMYKGLTRIFAEAGESWVVLIARMPRQFRSLVEAVLECCARDSKRDVLSLTFLFWFELKQFITLERYIEAHTVFADIYSKLVDIMIKHLEFPTAEDGDETDLFDGDREDEEKFREFRHAMGDVLKDCCEVIGVTECLGKSYRLIQQWVNTYGPQATSAKVPRWQELEAPLFSMRAMGRMVNAEENTILPQVMPLIVQIPDHDKLRFQAIMALARYTEWTEQHPETLENQLNYVMTAFNHSSKEVVQAAALAFKFLGTDCRKLLGGHLAQLHSFYGSVIDKLPPTSQEEITEGVAAVVSVQPTEKIYESMKLFCDPLKARVMELANNAKDDAGQKRVADELQLITIFIQLVQPYVGPNQPNPAVKYCEELLEMLAKLVEFFPHSTPILERVCRCWRYMVISYRTAMAPLLPVLAQNLATGFEKSRQGCFLWATDSIIREFSEGAEFVDQQTSQAIYGFFEQQVTAFLRILNGIPPQDLPDVIEDFFRLLLDAVIYYPQQLILSSLITPIVSAALTALTLQQHEPLSATLHFLRDLLSFGTDTPNTTTFDPQTGRPLTHNPPEIQAAVKALLAATGAALVQRVLTGMMFTFPDDVFPDASGVLLAVFEIQPPLAAVWVHDTIQLLPTGSVKPVEAERLMTSIAGKIQAGEMRKVRVLLQDFTNSYRRRNVAPREGLGRLEAQKFRFTA